LHVFCKTMIERLSRLYSNEFKLATSKTLGYNMPRGKMIPTDCQTGEAYLRTACITAV